MMTKEDIKKAFDICFAAQKSCNGCPLLGLEKQNGRGCKYNLFTSVFDLVNEQEKEIERLKAENEKYLDSIESVQAGRCRLRCQLTEQAVKQAKIDVLNELKEKIVERMGDREYMGVKYKQGVFSESEIDEMIKEQLKK